MSISVMKLALEALENTYAYLPRRWGGEVEADQAISALRQAIAEAEKQEPVVYQCPRCSTSMDIDHNAKPVHASDISQECVDETAKGKHDLWIAAACLKSTVESAIKAGDWKVDGACDPTRDLAYLADCLANPKREWVEQPDLARVGEVGIWGDK